MSGSMPPRAPSISLEAAHAADKEKEVTYPPRPLADEPDYGTLRAEVLVATRDARRHVSDT